MIKNRFGKAAILATVGLAFGLSACTGLDTLPTAELGKEVDIGDTVYRISSDDSLQIFVWRNPELSRSTVVRPDGKITVPLIEDMPVVGKTPTELARELEKKLSTYVQDPIVTVMMGGFVGLYEDRIRIVGEAARPQALPYRSTMTLLDVMIQVGGITEFAAGNRATITRIVEGQQKQYRIYIDDLLDGDLAANVKILPGDIIVVPEAWF